MHDPLSRARFLRLSAIAAAGTVVAACAQGTSTATTGSASSAAPASTASSAAPTTAATSAAASSPAATTSAAASVSSSSAASTSAAAATMSAASTSSVATSASSMAASTSAAGTAAASTGAATSASTSGAVTGIGRATPLTFSGELKEAPMLAAMVKAGSLPAVKDRLPDNPYVVPHAWLSTGKYGGTMQWATSSSDDSGTTQHVQESMYGHSHLRWLKDGLEIGPGLVESWESNSDQSQWTLHFRKGLKWSDGKPWTTADILFWWEDEVQTPDLKELPPDEMRSGKGTLGTLKAVDDTTLQMNFDAPAPLTADRLAMWVKRGIGPRWMDPKHYLMQFHPKYNPGVDKTKWVDNFILMRAFQTNPACPTMTGWMLKQYNKGSNSIWTRNPYYWVVDKEGNQLPYIDGLTMTNFQNAEVMKLQITSGKIDFGGNFWPFSLADVSTFKQAQDKSQMEVRFWDGGDGTGSAWFFNYDYAEPKMRDLIRNPKFRQALSLAVNRDNIQRSVYFNTGEKTTGTMSPKAIEYHVAGGQQVYQQWRDSYIKYDPEQAKQMLDSIGVKMNGQWRTMPDGSPLNVTLDYGADANQSGAPVKKDELVAADWQAIGINAKLNPVTPTSRSDQWQQGKIMTNADWGVGDGPNCLVYPQWLIPLEPTRWAPLEGNFYSVKGTPAEKQQLDIDPYKRTPPRMDAVKGGPVEKLWNLYDQTKVEPDEMKRTQLVWEISKVHWTDGPFFSGTVANTPTPMLVKQGLKNVPQRDDLAQKGFTGPWIIPTPAVYDPETFYWDNPDQHK